MDNLKSFESWALNSRGLAPKTVKEHVRNVIRARQAWTADHPAPFDAVQLPELEEFFFSLTTSPTSRNSIRYALIAYWDYLEHSGAILGGSNPARGLPKIRRRHSLPKPLSLDELKRLLEESRRPTRTGNPLKWECLITVFVGTGLRLSEVTNLRWESIRGDVAHLVQKGGGEREVLLGAMVIEVLARWRPQCPSMKWVFPSPERPESPLTTLHVYKKVKELGERAGVLDLHPHRFRHSFATMLYEATGDIVKVKEAMGHAEIANTMIYTRVNPKGVRDAVNALAIWDVPEPGDMSEPNDSPITSPPPDGLEASVMQAPDTLVKRPCLDELLFELSAQDAGSRAQQMPDAITAPSRAYVDARRDLEEILGPKELAKFRALQGALEEIRKWELIRRGRYYLLAGAWIASGVPIDARRIAYEAAVSTQRSAEKDLAAPVVPSFLTL